jgi:hypothetical protein
MKTAPLVKWIAMLLTLIPAFSFALEQTPAHTKEFQPPVVHDRDFWRAIVRNGYAVPEKQQAFPLVRELSSYLGSRDPELRDDLAYSIIATWIVRQKQLSASELGTLLDEWRANLRIGIGESGTDSVLRRSFSALCLAALARRDLKTPFLGEDRYRALLSNALAYLSDERDLRGFDPALGWIHAIGHSADLLAELASNPLFRTDDQGRLLDAISQRLSSGLVIFTYGEQDRLASAAATIAGRPDFDAAVFQRWLIALDGADQKVWRDSPPKQDLLMAFENDTYMLRGLAAHLLMSPPNAAVAEAQKAVLGALKSR